MKYMYRISQMNVIAVKRKICNRKKLLRRCDKRDKRHKCKKQQDKYFKAVD